MYNTEIFNITSGKFGTSSWYIDSEGVLHIQEGRFAYTDSSSPWYAYKEEINKIVFEGKVVAGARSNYLFKDLSSVTSFENMRNFDMSEIRGGYSIFENCSSLFSLDLSQTRASFVANDNLFSGCTNLRNINVEGVKFDVNSRNVFKNNYNLSEITIDTNFRFSTNSVGLPDVPNNETYSGKWVNVGYGSVDNPLGSIVLSSSSLTNIAYKTADTYVWHKNPVKAKDLTILYQDIDGNEIAKAKTISGNIGDNYDVSTGTDYDLEIEGYSFKEIKGTSTGILSDIEQTVTYIYSKKIKSGKTITNQKNTLPQAGESINIIPIITGFLILFIFFSSWIIKKIFYKS
ncbi:hypothetical protein A5819_003668 [Enterococcus sp. 7E2_DIV0204]|uniref:MucBP domain-containing protein n=1 Tax=unclassified Enterococcus TaxID=2608891 RepID=UPI000A34EDDD|nr:MULTISPECIES: MucBP domain-containing protein [unclassified Enterococcus]OTN83849.1 hypothetical protein A5819_003668 [Enterococcus sp. 7E2_DIV0204]OTP47509.1 hypothetical protein A5884_003480 [Enterococcus sp. 7D2_DIV0200]